MTKLAEKCIYNTFGSTIEEMRLVESLVRHVRSSQREYLICSWKNPDVADVDEVVVVPDASRGQTSRPIVLETLSVLWNETGMVREVIWGSRHRTRSWMAISADDL